MDDSPTGPRSAPDPGAQTHHALTHVDADGGLRMVDVSSKPSLRREALAEGRIRLQPATLDLIRTGSVAKGNVLSAAQLAGILAAKDTSRIIPLCHSLPLSHVSVEFVLEDVGIRILARATTVAGTGVEMEALTAVAVAALTLYDMCKAVDKVMVIESISLLEKTKRPL